MKNRNERVELLKLKYIVDFVFAKIETKMQSGDFVTLKKLKKDLVRDMGCDYKTNAFSSEVEK